MRRTGWGRLLLSLWIAVAGCGKQEDYAAHQRAELEANKAKAEKGDGRAAYEVGEAYRFGRGVPKDLALATTWYGKAADVGNESASLELAWMVVEAKQAELAAVCGKAFEKSVADTAGKARPPALLLWRRDESDVQDGSRSSTAGADQWRSDNNHRLPAKLLARSLESLQSVVGLVERFVQVGTYEATKTAAVRIDYEVRVVRWPSGELLAARTFRGADPPAQRTSSSGVKSWEHGQPPDAAAVEAWLSEVFAP